MLGPSEFRTASIHVFWVRLIRWYFNFVTNMAHADASGILIARGWIPDRADTTVQWLSNQSESIYLWKFFGAKMNVSHLFRVGYFRNESEMENAVHLCSVRHSISNASVRAYVYRNVWDVFGIKQFSEHSIDFEQKPIKDSQWVRLNMFGDFLQNYFGARRQPIMNNQVTIFLPSLMTSQPFGHWERAWVCLNKTFGTHSGNISFLDGVIWTSELKMPDENRNANQILLELVTSAAVGKLIFIEYFLIFSLLSLRMIDCANLTGWRVPRFSGWGTKGRLRTGPIIQLIVAAPSIIKKAK